MYDAAKTQANLKPLEGTELDLDAREQALTDFKDLLQGSVRKEELERWMAKSEVRQSVFADVAMGRVRWPKSLGRPDAAELAAGFVFAAEFWVDVWHIGIDGSIVTDITGWQPGYAPSVFDGIAEPDHYSVTYMFNAAKQNDNLLEVRFSHVPWIHPGQAVQRQTARYLSSTGWRFYSAGNFTALPEITIDRRPFFHT